MKLPLNPFGHPSVRHPSSPSHHPSTESLTLQLSARVRVVGGRVKVVGGWKGGFFSSCIWCGEWTMDFSCKFYLGAGGRIYFPFSQWEDPRCLAFIPFKFGGREIFFFHFSLFPNVFSRCSL
jgi:hypothetical protein